MDTKFKIDDRRTFLHTQMWAGQMGKAKGGGDRPHECKERFMSAQQISRLYVIQLEQ